MHHQPIFLDYSIKLYPYADILLSSFFEIMFNVVLKNVFSFNLDWKEMNWVQYQITTIRHISLFTCRKWIQNNIQTYVMDRILNLKLNIIYELNHIVPRNIHCNTKSKSFKLKRNKKENNFITAWGVLLWWWLMNI